MFVKNPKLIPKTLIDLASYYNIRELEVYYKRPKWAKTKEYSWTRGVANQRKNFVCLFLRDIMWHHWIHYEYWFELLRVFLHEVGHIKTPHPLISLQRHEKDERLHQIIEARADHWRDKEITRLVSLDDMLFEPKYLGIFDIINRYKFKGEDYRYINEIRSRKIGSQYSLSKVINKIFGLYSYNVSFYAEEPKGLNEKQKKNYRETRERLKSANRQYERAKRLVKRIAEGRSMGKIYVDGAGRKHLFFNYGEVERLKEIRLIWEVAEYLREVSQGQRRLSVLRGKLQGWKMSHFRLPAENIMRQIEERTPVFDSPGQLKLFE